MVQRACLKWPWDGGYPVFKFLKWARNSDEKKMRIECNCP